MSKKEVTESLKLLLVNTYALYIKTQNYHWNVSGPNFYSLHIMFEEQYKDLAEAVDTIAERMRTLGERAPASFSLYNKLKTISDPDHELASNNMLKDLVNSHEEILHLLNKLVEISQKSQDRTCEDLAIQRISIHEKTIWKLKSSL